MRTGSTWLATLLDSHPDIDCKLELLHKVHYRGNTAGAKAHLDDKLFGISAAKYRGFKVMYHQMRGINSAACQELANLFTKTYLCKIIHIRRRNLLETFVSHRLAQRSGVWNLGAQTIRSKASTKLTQAQCRLAYNRPMTLDPADYRLFVSRIREWEAKALQLFPGCFEVFYEDLPGAAYAVLDFLDAPQMPLVAKTEKLRQLPLEEIVANYVEMAAIGFNEPRSIADRNLPM